MRIFVAGHKGMVGSAILRKLQNSNNTIITKDKSDLDLLDQAAVNTFFKNIVSNQLIRQKYFFGSFSFSQS